MKAKVKSDHRWKTVVAFSGIEYVKDEWRKVPPSMEKDAESHPHLEVQYDKAEAEARKSAKPTAEAKLDEMLEGKKPTADAKLEEMVVSQPVEIEVEPGKAEVKSESEPKPKSKSKSKSKKE